MLTSERSFNIVQHSGRCSVFPIVDFSPAFPAGHFAFLSFFLSLNAFTKDYWREPCMIIMIGLTIRRSQATIGGAY